MYHCHMPCSPVLLKMEFRSLLKGLLVIGLALSAHFISLRAQCQVRMEAVEKRLDALTVGYADSLFPGALFAMVYRNSLRMQLNGFAAGAIRDTLGMARMSETFFSFFDSALHNFRSGKVNAPAWHAVFHPPGERTLLHAMLLGIHAHVYNDLKPALMKAFDAEGLKAFRRDYFRLNRGFRCINRQLEIQLIDAMQLKSGPRKVFQIGSRWMMGKLQRERRRAYGSARRGFRQMEKGKQVQLVNENRIRRNIRRLEGMFINPPLKKKLALLDGFPQYTQLRLLDLSGCDVQVFVQRERMP